MPDGKLRNILIELKNHAPFTLFGALTGIVCMFAFKNVDEHISHKMFYIFHPLHVTLSAIVTTSIYILHSAKKRIIALLLIGLVGSIGVATVSDSLIPYVGETLLGMRIDVHAAHEHTNFAQEAHIGFIEEWQLVMPAAIIGIAIAFFRPKTKFPHAGHILISTWASAFHMIMAMGGQFTIPKLIGSFIFLFLAVWLPCCFSDIVFPLLFINKPHCPHCPHG